MISLKILNVLGWMDIFFNKCVMALQIYYVLWGKCVIWNDIFTVFYYEMNIHLLLYAQIVNVLSVRTLFLMGSTVQFIEQAITYVMQ